MDTTANKYIGQMFDNRYKIKRLIGSGGMAVVFEAIDTFSGRRVAIKMLKDAAANNTQAIKRFVIESKAVEMLDHENIVKIYGISVRGDHKYIVMEYLEGISLRDYMKTKGPLDWREAVAFIEQILAALDHSHMKGVVHRDIKPQNIMILERGVVKVTDFGIAKIPKAETLTMADKAIGTVFYISPEQAQSKKVDPRSDLYSLGVMFYEMVTGKLPFIADTPVAVILKHIKDKPLPPTQLNSKIPIGLEQIILCAMEKEPAARYQSASQMLRHLRRLKQDPTVVFVQRQITQTTRNPSPQPMLNSGELPAAVQKPSAPAPQRRQPAKPKQQAGSASTGKKPVKNKPDDDSESSGVPLWVAACIFTAFLVIAIVGVILLYNAISSDTAAPAMLPAKTAAENLLKYVG